MLIVSKCNMSHVPMEYDYIVNNVKEQRKIIIKISKAII